MGGTANRVMESWSDASNLARNAEQASELDELRARVDAFERAERLAEVGSFRLDYRSNEIRWSPQAYRIFGVRADMPIDIADILEQTHPEDVGTLMLAARELPKRGKLSPFTYRILRKDGEVRTLLARCELVNDASGIPLFAMGTVTDVTGELRVSERARQGEKLQDLGRIVGSVAHDLNNLLAIISAGATVAERASSEPKVKTELAELLKTSGACAELLRHMLAFSRRQDLKPRVVGLDEIVAPLEWMLVRLLGPQIDLTVSIDDDLWSVEVDPGAIERVIVNLALNSKDALPNGGTVFLRGENRVIERDGKSVEYTVIALTDSGVGMSEATLGHAFEPFFSTKGERGAGLGLATSQGIARDLGGFIQAESKLGVGTTMSLFLPRTTKR